MRPAPLHPCDPNHAIRTSAAMQLVHSGAALFCTVALTGGWPVLADDDLGGCVRGRHQLPHPRQVGAGGQHVPAADVQRGGRLGRLHRGHGVVGRRVVRGHDQVRFRPRPRLLHRIVSHEFLVELPYRIARFGTAGLRGGGRCGRVTTTNYKVQSLQLQNFITGDLVQVQSARRVSVGRQLGVGWNSAESQLIASAWCRCAHGRSSRSRATRRSHAVRFQPALPFLN